MEKTGQNYYRSLYKVAAAVNSAHTPDDVLHSIAENVAQALEAKLD